MYLSRIKYVCNVATVITYSIEIVALVFDDLSNDQIQFIPSYSKEFTSFQ